MWQLWLGLGLIVVALAVIMYIIFWSTSHINDPVDWEPLDDSEYDEED